MNLLLSLTKRNFVECTTLQMYVIKTVLKITCLILVAYFLLTIISFFYNQIKISQERDLKESYVENYLAQELIGTIFSIKKIVSDQSSINSYALIKALGAYQKVLLLQDKNDFFEYVVIIHNEEVFSHNGKIKAFKYLNNISNLNLQTDLDVINLNFNDTALLSKCLLPLEYTIAVIINKNQLRKNYETLLRSDLEELADLNKTTSQKGFDSLKSLFLLVKSENKVDYRIYTKLYLKEYYHGFLLILLFASGCYGFFNKIYVFINDDFLLIIKNLETKIANFEANNDSLMKSNQAIKTLLNSTKRATIKKYELVNSMFKNVKELAHEMQINEELLLLDSRNQILIKNNLKILSRLIRGIPHISDNDEEINIVKLIHEIVGMFEDFLIESKIDYTLPTGN